MLKDSVDIIICTLDVTKYDQGYGAWNGLKEEAYLFKRLCSCFDESKLVILATHNSHLLADKLKRTNIKELFPEYTGNRLT